MTLLSKSAFLRYGALIAAAVATVVIFFPGFVRNLFSTGYFMPHATCYLREPGIIWLHVTSDSIIGLAYVSIALTLGYLVHKASKDIPFHWMLLAFGLFIVSCGFTHLMEVWTVWKPLYWLSGYVKAITAAASLVTALALFPLVPRIFRSISEVKITEERRLELIRTHEDLHAQKAQLEVANRDLEMFAYSVAHDLRGPSRTIAGMCELLKEDHMAQMPPETQFLIGRILEASRRSQSLLTDLLEYSRVSRDELQLGPVPLDDAVAEAIAAHQKEIEQFGAVVKVETQGLVVNASSTLLMEVLSNYIGNAVKYVAEGVTPLVRIWTEKKPGAIRIWVEDNGIGIEPNQQQRIFSLFYRLHHESEYPGTGLGLAIAQRAAERMRGTVGVESEPGKGSRFWLELSDD